RTGNLEVEWAVAGATDRLHRPRGVELDLIPEFADEALILRRLAAEGPAAGLRQAIVAYHRRRLRLVASIVRNLHGLGGRDPRPRPAE
ncbi:MAG TPA: GntR family transcriptional regulator, partial [Caulobacter sp.]|nr:GntR family transcriptional regulator [Caulobacter sp.]